MFWYFLFVAIASGVSLAAIADMYELKTHDNELVREGYKLFSVPAIILFSLLMPCFWPLVLISVLGYVIYLWSLEVVAFVQKVKETPAEQPDVTSEEVTPSEPVKKSRKRS